MLDREADYLPALNLLKQDTTRKLTIKNRRLLTGWDEPYLLHLLGLLVDEFKEHAIALLNLCIYLISAPVSCTLCVTSVVAHFCCSFRSIPLPLSAERVCLAARFLQLPLNCPLHHVFNTKECHRMSTRRWSLLFRTSLRSSLRKGLLVLALISLVLPAAPAFAQLPDGGMPPAAYLPLVNQDANGDRAAGDMPNDVWGEIAGNIYANILATVGSGLWGAPPGDLILIEAGNPVSEAPTGTAQAHSRRQPLDTLAQRQPDLLRRRRLAPGRRCARNNAGPYACNGASAAQRRQSRR